MNFILENWIPYETYFFKDPPPPKKNNNNKANKQTKVKLKTKTKQLQFCHSTKMKDLIVNYQQFFFRLHAFINHYLAFSRNEMFTFNWQ